MKTKKLISLKNESGIVKSEPKRAPSQTKPKGSIDSDNGEEGRQR